MIELLLSPGQLRHPDPKSRELLAGCNRPIPLDRLPEQVHENTLLLEHFRSPPALRTGDLQRDVLRDRLHFRPFPTAEDEEDDRRRAAILHLELEGPWQIPDPARD